MGRGRGWGFPSYASGGSAVSSDSRPAYEGERHMKVGVWIPSVRRFASNENIRASILQAERLGYDSIWTIDHIIAPTENARQFGLIYDPLIVMALAAGLTERIQIGV